MALITESWGEGPDLVFIHGWRAHSALWRMWIQQHFLGYRITLIDLPGHGNSAPIQRTNAPLMDDWIGSLVEVLPEHAIIAGWSLGGLLAQQLAISHPQRVRALILIAASPCFVQREDWKPALSRPLIHQYIQEVSNNAVTLFKSFFMLQSLGSPNPKRLYQQLIASLMVLATDIPSLKQGLQLLEDIDLRPTLTQIQQPSLWLFAEKDAIVPIALSQEIATFLPDSHCKHLPNCGHLPFMTCPDGLAVTIQSFLDELAND